MTTKESFNEFDAQSEQAQGEAIRGRHQEPRPSTTSKGGALVFRVAIALVVLAVFCALGAASGMVWLCPVGLLAALLCYLSVHIVVDWERAVILRFGSFNRVAGPGLVFTIPFAEYVTSSVDLRMRSTSFGGERVLTSDLVPVDVDAVLIWTVWDAKRACTEIENYERSVYLAAQTALRDAIGSMNVAQMGSRRQQIDKQISRYLEEKTNDWGISVVSVDIRDVVVPTDLQTALSAEARAEREYNARVLLAEVEDEISDMYVDAARKYKTEDGALQLRAMSMVSDSVKEKGGAVVIPSALSEAFENLGDLGSK